MRTLLLTLHALTLAVAEGLMSAGTAEGIRTEIINLYQEEL
jgi:hypothetical protein